MPYLENYENPLGTKITDNLTALYFFFERNELLEPTFSGLRIDAFTLYLTIRNTFCISSGSLKAISSSFKNEGAFMETRGVFSNVL